MEFEDVSEQIEYEARRVAAAFEITEWEEKGDTHSDFPEPGYYYKGTFVQRSAILFCIVSKATGEVIQIDIDGSPSPFVDARVFLNEGCWALAKRLNPQLSPLMARGLYRLGFDEAILDLLPPLTAHEKLELRLSLPREFWPKKWLEEAI